MAREVAVRYGLALVGRELDPWRDGCIYVDRDGFISSIERSCPQDRSGGPDALVIPPAALAHAHSADYAFPEIGVSMRLSDLVAPPDGLKHRMLSRVDYDTLVARTREFYELAHRLGVGLIADFRELGGVGCLSARQAARGLPGLEVIALGRPGPRWPEGCDGVGLSSPLDYSRGELESILRGHKIRATHVAETPASRQAGDLEAAIEAGFNVIIHGTFLSRRDLETLKGRIRGLVLCAGSNMWHGLGLPPVRQVLEVGIPLGLGSDNAAWMPPDPWAEARTALLVARAQGLRSEIAAKSLLEGLFVWGYEMFGRSPPLVCEGCPAGFLVVRGADSAILRAESVYSAIVKRVSTGSIIRVSELLGPTSS